MPTSFLCEHRPKGDCHETDHSREILASRTDCALRDPANELGAMPPLGHLYGLDVYVDLPLSHREQIVFNGGTHEEAIAMPYREFEKLSRTQIVEIGKPYKKKAPISGALQI